MFVPQGLSFFSFLTLFFQLLKDLFLQPLGVLGKNTSVCSAAFAFSLTPWLFTAGSWFQLVNHYEGASRHFRRIFLALLVGFTRGLAHPEWMISVGKSETGSEPLIFTCICPLCHSQPQVGFIQIAGAHGWLLSSSLCDTSLNKYLGLLCKPWGVEPL